MAPCTPLWTRTKSAPLTVASIGFIGKLFAEAIEEISLKQVEAVRAVHPPGRGPHSSVVAEAVGYVLRTDDACVYFAGDTDLFDEMADLAPIDVALLPIWGWGPSLGEGHLDPGRAARAATLLQARVVIPVHWGTYSPIGVKRPKWLDTPVGQFADRAADAGGVILQRERRERGAARFLQKRLAAPAFGEGNECGGVRRRQRPGQAEHLPLGAAEERGRRQVDQAHRASVPRGVMAIRPGDEV